MALFSSLLLACCSANQAVENLGEAELGCPEQGAIARCPRPNRNCRGAATLRGLRGVPFQDSRPSHRAGAAERWHPLGHRNRNHNLFESMWKSASIRALFGNSASEREFFPRSPPEKYRPLWAGPAMHCALVDRWAPQESDSPPPGHPASRKLPHPLPTPSPSTHQPNPGPSRGGLRLSGRAVGGACSTSGEAAGPGGSAGRGRQEPAGNPTAEWVGGELRRSGAVPLGAREPIRGECDIGPAQT